MTDSRGGAPARRRRRSARPGRPQVAEPPAQGAPAGQGSSTRPPPPPEPASTPEAESGPRRRSPRSARSPREPAERGMHDLLGAGGSQLGVSGALRARDVNRPGEQDLADAERDLAIVRRHWKPAP